MIQVPRGVPGGIRAPTEPAVGSVGRVGCPAGREGGPWGCGVLSRVRRGPWGARGPSQQGQGVPPWGTGCSLQRGQGVPGGLSASPSEDGRSLGTRTRSPRGSPGARWWFLGGGWGAFRPAAASPRFLYPPPPKIKRGKKGPRRAGIPLRLRVQQPAGPPDRSSTARGRRFPPAVSAPWRPLWAGAGSVGGSVLPGCREDGGGVFVGAGFGADGAGRAAAAGLPGGPGTVPFPRNSTAVPEPPLKQLLCGCAHICPQHMDSTVQLQEEPQLSSAFQHFSIFVQVNGGDTPAMEQRSPHPPPFSLPAGAKGLLK
ncbi:collagen alpha-2(I) chain-like [Heliangelus exortis]|uniref:collagen alpha-2(I) chain-like n=1 Tax=Heliangelus exortis TaxID=472823 RepID=UPI003A92CBEB